MSECLCGCVFSYSESLLLSPVRPKLLDMASPEATETQNHTERDRECVLTEMRGINIHTEHSAEDYNTTDWFTFCLCVDLLRLKE